MPANGRRDLIRRLKVSLPIRAKLKVKFRALFCSDLRRERLDEFLRAVALDHIARSHWLYRRKDEKEFDVCRQIVDATSSYANFLGKATIALIEAYL